MKQNIKLNSFISQESDLKPREHFFLNHTSSSEARLEIIGEVWTYITTRSRLDVQGQCDTYSKQLLSIKLQPEQGRERSKNPIWTENNECMR